MLSTIFILAASAITASASDVTSDLSDIRASSAFRAWAVECTSPTVTTSLLSERSTGANASVRFIKTKAVCATAKTGLFALDQGSVTFLSTCAEDQEPCGWDLGPSIEASSGAIAAIVISSDWGGDTSLDAPIQFERLIVVRQKKSGGWLFSKMPNSALWAAELPSDEFSDYQVEATAAGFGMTVKQQFVGSVSEAMFRTENEYKYLLRDGSITLLSNKLVSGSFQSWQGLDVYATEETERPWFRFTPGSRITLLSCRVSSKKLRWKVTDGHRTGYVDRFLTKVVPVACEL